MNPSHQRITLGEFITTIQSPSDILKAVSSSNDYIEEISSDNAKSYFNQSQNQKQKQKPRIIRQQSHFVGSVMSIPHQTSPVYNQMAALILMIPVKFIPNEVFQWCSKIFPFLSSFPQIVSAGLMMRFAESSLILNKVDTTLQTMRWGINRYSFINCAYLYLCSASKNPIEYEITTLTNYARVDCMTFYYLGINFLMLHKYQKASESFLHSLTIHSPSDFAKEIASNFFLSCFLIHYTESQTRSLISDKFDISENVIKLFSQDDEIDLNSQDEDLSCYSDVFKFLIEDINKEIRKRKILRIAQASYIIPTEIFLKKANIIDQNELTEILKCLKNENLISFKIKDGAYTFSRPNLQPVIDGLNDSLMKSMDQLRLINQNNSEKNTDSNFEDDF